MISLLKMEVTEEEEMLLLFLLLRRCRLQPERKMKRNVWVKKNAHFAKKERSLCQFSQRDESIR